MFQRYEVTQKVDGKTIIRKARKGRFVLYSDVSVRYKLLCSFTIPGDPKTKKNQSMPILVHGRDCTKIYHKHVEKGWRIIIIPSVIYKKFEKHALNYVPLVPKPYEQINLRVLYYRETKRKVDLVNLQEATCDILVKGELILDDNATCVVSMDGSKVLYDKFNPRTEIFIERMYVGDKQIDLKMEEK